MFDMMLFIVAMSSMVAMVASAIPSFCLLRRGTGSQIAADWGLLLLGESEGMRKYEDDVARGGREGENIIDDDDGDHEHNHNHHVNIPDDVGIHEILNSLATLLCRQMRTLEQSKKRRPSDHHDDGRYVEEEEDEDEEEEDGEEGDIFFKFLPILREYLQRDKV